MSKRTEDWKAVWPEFLEGLAKRVGQEHWRQDEIARDLAISARDVRRMVRYTICRKGIPVCSSHKNGAEAGYFIPSQPGEALEATATLHKAALSLLKRESVLRRISVGELLGQMALELGGECLENEKEKIENG